ncbi:unnamed protein product [Symbiodinium pilosum]|uniref:Uncharacterized protein n=1 Tax=Symbiodinium pilosum TaxID=2952 RepID=A0A812QXJ1_SYMPI|nr:unnamed protein product [Symbiodinium pilosum]
MASLASIAGLQVLPEAGDEIFEVVILCAILFTLVMIPGVGLVLYRDVYEFRQQQELRKDLAAKCLCSAVYKRCTTKEAGLALFACASCQRSVKKVNFYFWRCETCSGERPFGNGVELCFRCAQARFPELRAPRQCREQVMRTGSQASG